MEGTGDARPLSALKRVQLLFNRAKAKLEKAEQAGRERAEREEKEAGYES